MRETLILRVLLAVQGGARSFTLTFDVRPVRPRLCPGFACWFHTTRRTRNIDRSSSLTSSECLLKMRVHADYSSIVFYPVAPEVYDNSTQILSFLRLGQDQ
jgi:hypothetical protein